MRPKRDGANDIRVQFRTTLEEKVFFEEAAHQCGFKNLSEFLRVSAHEKIRRELSNYQDLRNGTRRLSSKASRVVAESFLEPAKPNAKLKALLKKMKQ